MNIKERLEKYFEKVKKDPKKELEFILYIFVVFMIAYIIFNMVL